VAAALEHVGDELADALGIDAADNRLDDAIMALVRGGSYGRVDVEAAWDDPLDLWLTLAS